MFQFNAFLLFIRQICVRCRCVYFFCHSIKLGPISVLCHNLKLQFGVIMSFAAISEIVRDNASYHIYAFGAAFFLVFFVMKALPKKNLGTAPRVGGGEPIPFFSSYFGSFFSHTNYYFLLTNLQGGLSLDMRSSTAQTRSISWSVVASSMVVHSLPGLPSKTFASSTGPIRRRSLGSRRRSCPSVRL